MAAHILRGDALHIPLTDATVDLICTSPPYFALRSYTDNGQHYAGQLGSEPTPAAYVDALIAATAEMVRVLKPSGSIWLNLGDKYSGAQAQNIGGNNRAGDSAKTWAQTDPRRTGIPNKSLMGIPWRYALACIDQLGLILRAEIIWAKPNGLPESVTDRVRRSHEQWFHLVKQPRYYSAVDEIREAHAPASLTRYGSGFGQTKFSAELNKRYKADTLDPNPLGKLPGSVWTIPTQPLTVPPHLGVDHFAAFPMEWPRRIIRGWSPPGICVACGEGRRPVADTQPMVIRPSTRRLVAQANGGAQRTATGGTMLEPATRTITGYACACATPDAPTRPAVILDPFGGTGTTALVADALGRTGITLDMSADYNRIAQWRTSDPGQRAAALQVDKPAPVMTGQGDLFGGDAA